MHIHILFSTRRWEDELNRECQLMNVFTTIIGRYTGTTTNVKITIMTVIDTIKRSEKMYTYDYSR